MKAFLSHSSHDKELVEAVASELGRASCILDKWAFETGVDFKRSIERGLNDSSVFVLFASRNALNSVWVDFEISEAWFGKLQKKLASSLVYLIEAGLTADDLPEWLRRVKANAQNVPKAIARDISIHLNDLMLARQDPYFVGRTKEISMLEQALTPIDGSTPPRAAFIIGLPGIGRRTLLRHALPGILNLRRFVEIRISEGDNSNDICAKAADIIEPYNTREGFDRIFKDILSLSATEATKRTLNDMTRMIHAGEVPLFVDEGGLLDEDGNIREPVQAILKQLAPNDERYTFLVSHRRPQRISGLELPVVYVDDLAPDDTKRLVTRLAPTAGLSISEGEIARTAEYAAGYPPAAYFAIEEAKHYGIEIILRGRLVEFRTSVFLKHFADVSLSTEEKELLAILAFYSPLPLRIISEVFHHQPTVIDDILTRLIDLAFVVTTQTGFYRIADPIADVALRSFGYPGREVHRTIAEKLDHLLNEADMSGPRLDLSRALFRAASFAQDSRLADRALHLANDLIQLTESLYHQRNYRQAVEIGLIAIEQRPTSYRARSFVIRALIQEEDYEPADKQLQLLQTHAPLRDVKFLRGFLERKRGAIAAAVDAYHESERLGRNDAAISRELALCYLLSGSLDRAAVYISEALKKHGDNPYVVDLSAQIATRQKNEPAAREALQKLDLIGNKLYYHHRLSRVELAFGRIPEALAAAQSAVNCEDAPPFEALAQLAYCQMESGRLRDAAKVLERLEQRYGNTRSDVRVGLQCRLEIARKKFRDALAQSDRIKGKRSIFYKKIRRDALQGEVTYSALPDSERAIYNAEIEELDRELSQISAEQFLPAELTTVDISD